MPDAFDPGPREHRPWTEQDAAERWDLVQKEAARDQADCQLVASLPALEKQLDELAKKSPTPAMTQNESVARYLTSNQHRKTNGQVILAECGPTRERPESCTSCRPCATQPARPALPKKNPQAEEHNAWGSNPGARQGKGTPVKRRLAASRQQSGVIEGACADWNSPTERAGHSSGGVFGGKYPTSSIARSVS